MIKSIAFETEIALISEVFKKVKLTPLFEVRPYKQNSTANEYYLHINCKEYHGIMLRIMDGELFSHNKPALNLRKIKLPLNRSKLNRLYEKLKIIKELHGRLAKTNIKKFMGDLLEWTSIPNNQEAISKLMQYKRILSKYAKHDGSVFRGVILTKEELDVLKSGRLYVLNRPSSWANNLKTAQRYAKGYSGVSAVQSGNSIGVVFKADSPNVIFNVPAFVKANPNIMILAEANIYAPHLEPGSLYEAEIIVAPITLSYKNVIWTKKF